MFRGAEHNLSNTEAKTETLKKAIAHYRDKFNKLDVGFQKDVADHSYDLSLLFPCQIEYNTFGEFGTIWSIIHDPNREDLEITINTFESKDERKSYLERITEEYQWSTKLENWTKKTMESLASDGLMFIAPKNYMWTSYSSENPIAQANQLLEITLDIVAHEIENEKHMELQEIAESLKEDVETISEEKVRARFEETSSKMNEVLKKFRVIDEHKLKIEKMESELSGVRKLVGTKSYGEWKVLVSEIDKINTRIDCLKEIREAYDKVLGRQDKFMEQQAEVMKQQSSFLTWIKYATILVPIAVVSVPIIEILIRHFLGIS